MTHSMFCVALHALIPADTATFQLTTLVYIYYVG